MNERIVRQGQREQEIQTQQNAMVVRAQDALVDDVKDGARQALVTQNPNQFAMAFVGKDDDGNKTVAPYIKKAGRSVILNEVAKKKGGIALMQPVCVRSALETKEDLVSILTALPSEMKSEFIKSRGGDFRCLSYPNGRSLFKFRILFRNGEKWEGEGIAWPGNTRMSSLHTRLDELAQTRAFMRCVGLGTADGFIDPEQVAGEEHMDMAEQVLLEEDAAFEAEVAETEGAAPDGDDSFRTPDSGGAHESFGGPAGPAGTADSHPAEAGTAAADTGESLPAAGADSGAHHAGDRGPDAGEAVPRAAVETVALMNLARSKGVFLLKLAQEKFGAGIKSLNLLTDFQKSILFDEIKDMPDKPPHREG